MTDLRAEVARAIDAARSEGLRGQADAAIAVVLEAAAKVAEGRASHHEYVKRAVDGEWEAGSPYDRGAVKASQDIAKAIRQMGSI